MQPTILITIDVEDWFQVENFKPWIPFETWDQRELRVEKNTHLLLDLFDSLEVSHRAKRLAHGVEDAAGTKDELENFRPRRIARPVKLFEKDSEANLTGEFSHFHPGSGKDKRNPVNPVKENEKRIQATFFVLGWIAERLPHLIREIHTRGHEIASHGYNHNLCYQQSQAELKRELTDSKKLLEDITGSPVFGFRAPNFSINDNTLKTIEDCGYFYDSSYNSFNLHGRYGKISLNGHSKKGIAHKISNNFFELPISNLEFENIISYWLSAKCIGQKGRKRIILPWGGGAYFRLIPYRFFRHGVQSIMKRDGAYVFYLHPWEIDPDQLRQREAFMIYKFRHYVNLRKTYKKLIDLFDGFFWCHFVSCNQYLTRIA